MSRNASVSLVRQLLDAIVSAQSQLALDFDPKTLAESLLAALLELTESEYGFICETSSDGRGPERTSALLSGRTADATRRAFCATRWPVGQDCPPLEALLGAVMASDELVLGNGSLIGPRRGGGSEGHAPTHFSSWACRFAMAMS